MKTKILILAFLIIGIAGLFAQDDYNMDRTERCKQTYKELFGGEALTGKGNDPELMDILQKFIFGEVFYVGDLTTQKRELLTVVSLASMQTLPQLKAHVGASLNVGVTPLEVREAIYMCAPFIGFPKTLNAIGVANEVFTERGIALPLEESTTVTEADRIEKGKAIQESLYGAEMHNSFAGLPDNYQDTVSNLLTGLCFGDFYTRKGLSLADRELVVLTILMSEGLIPQIKPHIAGSMKLGTSKETLCDVMIHLAPYIGFARSLNAIRILRDIDQPDQDKNMVRLSKIVVEKGKLEEYNALLKEEIEASMFAERGVLTLYAVAEKERPNHITILEIYADEDAYQSHIKTPHFLKYKQGTLDMIRNLELVDVSSLIPGMKIK